MSIQRCSRTWRLPIDNAEGAARIAQQAKLVGDLDADGPDTIGAQNLLRIMQRNLDVMNTHRQTIMRELAGAPDEQS